MGIKSTRKVYAFRVLFRYEGTHKKPTSKQVEKYLSDSLATSRVEIPSLQIVHMRGGKVVGQDVNHVDFSVALLKGFRG